MYTKKLSISKRFQIATTAINNAMSNASIAAYMAALGYDAVKMNEGKSLLEQTQALHLQKNQKFNEQKAATTTRDTIRQKIDTTYTTHRKLAKVAFKKMPIWAEALRLKGRKGQTLITLKAQVNAFYTTALNNADIHTELAKFKVTVQDLQDIQQQIVVLENAEALQKQKKGAAQQATLARDEVFAQLDEWMKDFQAVAKAALAQEPQLIEALGIVAKR